MTDWTEHKMMDEKVTLVVPADYEYASLVRQVAANLGTLIDMTIDEIADIRLAVDEAFVYACQTNTSGFVTLDFLPSKHKLAIEVSLGEKPVQEEIDNPGVVYAAFIIDAMCDEYEISDGPDAILRLVKVTGEHDVRA